MAISAFSGCLPSLSLYKREPSQEETSQCSGSEYEHAALGVPSYRTHPDPDSDLTLSSGRISLEVGEPGTTAQGVSCSASASEDGGFFVAELVKEGLELLHHAAGALFENGLMSSVSQGGEIAATIANMLPAAVTLHHAVKKRKRLQYQEGDARELFQTVKKLVFQETKGRLYAAGCSLGGGSIQLVASSLLIAGELGVPACASVGGVGMGLIAPLLAVLEFYEAGKSFQTASQMKQIQEKCITFLEALKDKADKNFCSLRNVIEGIRNHQSPKKHAIKGVALLMGGVAVLVIGATAIIFVTQGAGLVFLVLGGVGIGLYGASFALGFPVTIMEVVEKRKQYKKRLALMKIMEDPLASHDDQLKAKDERLKLDPPFALERMVKILTQETQGLTEEEREYKHLLKGLLLEFGVLPKDLEVISEAQTPQDGKHAVALLGSRLYL